MAPPVTTTTSAKPSLPEFLAAAKPANPGVSEEALTQHWAQTYGQASPTELPTYEEFLPKAKEANPGVPDAQLKQYWQRTYGDRGAREAEPKEDTTRGFKHAAQQVPQLGYGMIAGIGAAAESVVGEGGLATGIKKAGVKGYEEWGKKIEATSKRSDDISYAYDRAKEGEFGSLVDWLQYAIGYGGGQALQMLATAGIGGLAGKAALQPAVSTLAEKMVAKEAATIAGTEAAKKLSQQEIAKLATANVASRIGQNTAVAAAAYGMEGGEIFGDVAARSVKEGKPLSGEELAKAFGATVAAGSLEFVGDKFGLDIVTGRSVLNKVPGVAGKVAKAGVATVATAATEGGTEYAQTMIEEAGKGGDPFSDATKREALNAAALGAVGGGMIGGVGQVTQGAITPSTATAPSEPVAGGAPPPPPRKDELGKIPDAVGATQPAVGVDQAIETAQKIVEAPVTAADLDAAIEQQAGAGAPISTLPVQGPSVEEIHALADSKGIPWDNNAAFMDLTESVTGKRHLDTLTGPERQRVFDAVTAQPAAGLHPVLQGYLDAKPEAMHGYIREKMKGFTPEAMATLGGSSVPIQVLSWVDKTSALVKTPMGEVHLLSEAPSKLAPLPGQTAVPVYQAKAEPATTSKHPAVLQTRDKLPKAQSEALAQRAEVAASLVAQGEPGKRIFTPNEQGPGQTVTGAGSTYPSWYGPLNIPGTKKRPKKQRVLEALQKIVEGGGKDTGPDVEKVKEAILHDPSLDKLVGAFPESDAVLEVPETPAETGEETPGGVLPGVPRGGDAGAAEEEEEITPWWDERPLKLTEQQAKAELTNILQTQEYRQQTAGDQESHLTPVDEEKLAAIREAFPDLQPDKWTQEAVARPFRMSGFALALKNRRKDWQGVPDAEIRYNQAPDGKWVYSLSHHIGNQGFSSPLDIDDKKRFDTKEQAVVAAAREMLARLATRQGRGYPEPTQQGKADTNRLRAWLEQIIKDTAAAIKQGEAARTYEEGEADFPPKPEPPAQPPTGPGPGDKRVKEKLKAKREQVQPPAEPPKTAAPEPGPARTLNIFRGTHGAVKVVFPSQAHADLFSFGGRFRKSLAGGKTFDYEASQSFIRSQLKLPADYNVGTASIGYKAQIMAAIKGLPEGATYEAPAFTLKSAPAPAPEVTPETPPTRETPGQQEIAVPPPTIGEKPIIAPEAPLSETPLFSPQAQTEEPEQATLPTEPEPAPVPTGEPTDQTEIIKKFLAGGRGAVLPEAPTPVETPSTAVEEDEDEIRLGPAKLVDESRKEELLKQLKAMGRGVSEEAAPYGQEPLKPRYMANALQFGLILAQQGATKFAAWSQQMIEAIGTEVRPYLRATWEAMKALPRELGEVRANIAASLFEYGNQLYDKGATAKADFTGKLTKAFGKIAGPYADAVFVGIDTFKKAKPEKATKAAEPSKEISDQVARWLNDYRVKGEPLTKAQLFQWADAAYGGTQAEGAYTPKDAFDAMELGANKYILKHQGQFKFAPHGEHLDGPLAVSRIQLIRQHILDALPSQAGARTEEQGEFQQFSTPHDLAYAMAWLANLRGGKDVVLEPSAGTGDLAVFAKLAGIPVVVNELSPRRAAMLKQLGLTRVLTENAEQLNNLYPEEAPKPTVVLMNPPFSATAGRMEGARHTINVLTHIEQALKLLPTGGRLIVLIGDHTGGYLQREQESSVHGKTALSAGVLKGLAELPAQLQASIRISGEAYKKFGTTFTTRLLVYDKIPPRAGSVPVTLEVDNITAALTQLEGVRNARTYTTEGRTSPAAQPERPESGGAALPETGGRGDRPGLPTPLPTAPVGDREEGAETPSPELAGGATRDTGGTEPPTGPGGGVQLPDTQPGGTRPGGRPAQPGRPGTTGQPGGRGQETVRRPDDGDDRGRDTGLPTERPGAVTGVTVEGAEAARHEGEITDSVYEDYTPQKLRIPGAKPHPAPLVQSAAMAATEPPNPTYTPNLPKEMIEKGLLSLAQLEAVVGAGQSHQFILENGERQGYFIGDGTGVGKGREISGIILDNFRQGRPRAIWLSEKENLLDSAIRDWTDLGQDKKVFTLQADTDSHSALPNRNGILFTPYSTLAAGSTIDNDTVVAKFKKGSQTERIQSRLEQILKWAGPDFDGVIAFDEAHNINNTEGVTNERGTSDPSLQAMVAQALQRRLPKARVVYVSATAAKGVESMVYAERLGMWGQGTAFPNKNEFIAKMGAGGLGAMEVLSRDLKAEGKYLARSLSNEGVEYEQLQHELSDKQVKIYNDLAEAWQIVLQNIDEALQLTGIQGRTRGGEIRVKNGNAKGVIYGQFWSAHQAFFMQILTALSMPTTLAQMKETLARGESVVVSLVNTYEASQKRQLLEMKKEGRDLADLDLTPRQNLMEYVKNGFPVNQFEDYYDDKGNIKSRLVVDSKGNPVINKEAVEKRDALLAKLGSDALAIPDSPIDQILNTLGHKNVAEVTGRETRIRRRADGDPVEEKRTKALIKSEVQEFKDDKRKVLIFSRVGGTGESYDADRRIKNQRRRNLFVVQPGWQADKVIQALGRVHRSNEANQPRIVLTSTNVMGHKRFISTVARRLDGIGAMTQGERRTGSSALISAQDNIENSYAAAAVASLMQDLVSGNATGLDDQAGILRRMGLDNIKDKETGLVQEGKMPKVSKFLNRILALTFTEQNKVFEEFHRRMTQYVEEAAAKGLLDVGMETYRADGGITALEEQVVHTDPQSGAKTIWTTFEAKHSVSFVPFEQALKGRGVRPMKGFYRNDQSGKVWAVEQSYSQTSETGEVKQMYRLQGPMSSQVHVIPESNLAGYTKIGTEDARAYWAQTIEEAPTHRAEVLHMVSGALLKMWDRLPATHVRVMRLQTVDGQRYLGRIILNAHVEETREKLGVGVAPVTATPAEMLKKILQAGAKLELVNGWKIKAVRVGVPGETRLELSGSDLYANREEIKAAGGFLELRGSTTRFYLPTGPKAEAALTAIIKYHPVLRLRERDGEVMSPRPRYGVEEEQPSYGEIQLNLLAEDEVQEIEGGQDALAAQLDTTAEQKKKPRSKGEVLETLQDVGEKIGGARKDRWAGRGLGLEDLEGMTGGEQAKFVTKSNVWTRPDYAALVQDGMAKDAAAALKIIYDRIATGPRYDTDEGRRGYITMLGRVRDAYAGLKTLEQVKAVANERAFDDLPYEVRNSIRGRGSRGYSSPLRISWEEDRRIARMLREGFPNIEPWQRQFSVGQYDSAPVAKETADRIAKRVFESGREQWTNIYKSEAELSKLFQAQGIWLVSKKSGETVTFTTTEEAAKTIAKAAYDNLGETPGDKMPTRPHLDRLTREGPDVREGRDISAQDFMDEYGFRGVEFGNWAASDERQKHINQAYEALSDLAELLGIPNRAISLNGTLGLAFGARGHGSAAAHYEPTKMVINITKISGPGALAHEWGHALDHYFGELDKPDAYQGSATGVTGWRDEVEDYQRGRYLRHLRPEMQAAFKKLIDSLYTTNKDKAMAVRDAELGLEAVKGRIAEIQKSVAGVHERGDEKINKKYLAWADETLTRLARRKEQAGEELVRLREEPERPAGGYGSVESSFYQSAKALSGATGDYWKRPTELFARSFEAYVLDALGRKSQYLVHSAAADTFSTGYKGNPYPAGVERKAINAAYAELFNQMQFKPTEKGMALYEPIKPYGAETVPIFYSQVEQVLEEKMPGRASMEQLRGILSPKNGVKADELKWLGLDDYLKSKAYFTKAEVLDFVRANQVTVQEVMKGGGEPFMGQSPEQVSRRIERDIDEVRLEAERLGYTLEVDPGGMGNEVTISKDGEYLDDDLMGELASQAAERGELPTILRLAERYQYLLNEHDELVIGADAPTKYGSYTLPGGEDYRELLLTLPSSVPSSQELMELEETMRDAYARGDYRMLEQLRPQHERMEKAWKESKPLRPEPLTELPEGYEVGVDDSQPPSRRWHILPPGQIHARPFHGRHPSRDAAIREAIDAINTNRRWEWEEAVKKEHPVFKSSHWSEPNVLAHVRFNTRTDAQGKKVLFIEEIQSDWHQQGKRKGYRTELNKARAEAMGFSVYKAESNLGSEAYFLEGPYKNVPNTGHDTEEGAWKALLDYLRKEDTESVPDAPFKKTWPELVLKRMLRYAAEHGYDTLAWTTGLQQSERYNLAQYIDRVKINRPNDGSYQVQALDKDDRAVIQWQDAKDVNALAEIIGKDLAEKASHVPIGEEEEFTGVSLRVGGEGMKGFYDHIIPAFLSGYAKKWGAKVGTTTIKLTDMPDSEYEGFPPGHSYVQKNRPTVPSLDITPAMRDSVLSHGQAIFTKKAPYHTRPGENRQTALDLALAALGALDRAGHAVSATRGTAVFEGAGTPDARIRTVAVGLSPDLIHKEVVNLTGYAVTSAEDLAKLAQVYRNPQFETFRIIYLNGHKIVGHEGVSSRMPATAKVFVDAQGRDIGHEAWAAQKKATMRRLRATSYWLLHNHPSGNSAPSHQDKVLTAAIERILPGMQGHVIIDSNEFSEIHVEARTGPETSRIAGRTYRIGREGAADALLTPSLPHALLGEPVPDASAVVRLAKKLQTQAGYVTVLYRNATGEVRAIQELPVELFEDASLIRQQLELNARAFGSEWVLTHYQIPEGDHPASVDELSDRFKELIRDGFLTDHVFGHPWSARRPMFAPRHTSLYDTGTRTKPDMVFGQTFDERPAEVVREEIDAYQPNKAVSKQGDHWRYQTIEGTYHPATYDTKPEAIEAAGRHQQSRRERLALMGVEAYNAPYGSRAARPDGEPSADQDRAGAGPGASRDSRLAATRLKRADGRPLTFFRGDTRGRTTVDFSRLGQGTQHPSAGLGAFFSNSRADASRYGEVVTAFHLDLRNPQVIRVEELPDFDTVEDAIAYRRQLESQGFDGLIIRMDHLEGPIQVVAFQPEQIIAREIGGPSVAQSVEQPKAAYGKPLPYAVPAPTRLDAVIRTLEDKNIDIKRMVEAIKATGREVADELNPVLKEEMYMGRVAQRNKDFLTDELEPLLKQMMLNKVSLKELDRYLHARHAQEANAHLKELNPDLEDNEALSGMSDDEAQAILDAANRPLMDRLAGKVDAILAKTRTLLVDYGLESQKTVDTWAATYDFYVPLKRAGFDDELPGTGMGRNVRGPHSRARLGSHRAVIDILANVAMDRERAITRGEKMRPVIALAGLLMTNPNKEIATLAKATPITVTDPETGLEEELPGEFGDYKIPMIKYLDKSGQVRYRPDRHYKGRDNVVNFRIEGKDYAIIFNEQNERALHMAESLKNLDVGELSVVMSAIAPATRYLASVNTQYNPIFGVVNFIRDVQFAMLSLGSTPLAGKRKEILANALSSMQGIYADARAVRRGEHPSSATAQLWERFQHVGGPTGYRDLFRTSHDRARAIEHLLDPEWWQKTLPGKALTVGGLLAKPESLIYQKGLKPLLDWLSDYNLTMENAIRLAVFKAGLDSGLSDLKAASLAKNITVNFNKKGQVSAQMGAMFAFFNASVQGTARLAETLFEPGKVGALSSVGKKILAGGVTLGALQTFALAIAGFDDGEPPEWLKARSIVIPVPGTDRGYVSFPMPLGFHVIPSVGRLASEALLYGRPVDRVYRLASVVMDSFSPVGGAATVTQFLAPTVVDPIVALSENKDWTGRRIYKEDFNKLAPTPGPSRALNTASPWARGLAEAINYATMGTDYTPGALSPTPDAIDYLIGQAAGGIGRELSKTTQLIQGAVTGEAVPLYKVPLVGRFVGSSSDIAAVRQQFYQNLQDLNEVEAEIKGRRLNRQDVTGYLREHPEARLVGMANAMERSVQELNRRKRDLLRREGSREQVQYMEAQITSQMRRLNDSVRQLQGR